MVLTFDTHAVVKQLVAAGFTDQQAEAVTLVVREAHDVDLSNLVTKTEHQAGLAASSAEFQAGLAASSADFQAGLAASRADFQAGLAASRADLQAGLAAAKTDLQAVKADLEKSLAETKADILKWMIGTIGIQTIVIIGAVLSLLRFVSH